MTFSEKYYNVIGLMSGTSLDGVDLAHCTFVKKKSKWSFVLNKSTTIEYPIQLKETLKNAIHLSGYELAKLNVQLGKFFGDKCGKFIAEHELKTDLIASHGHTVFHQPNEGLTLQIGSGAVIAADTNVPTICDFRTTDVANKGQGAPLVPIGDALLFAEYDFCVNLGGFANISYENNGKRVAFDVCPVNMTLNWLVNQLNLDYDKNGAIAKKGIIIPELLSALNSLNYYQNLPPKSLGKEWHDKYILPLLSNEKHTISNLLRTFIEHIAIQMEKVLTKNKGTVLFTGGGTFNQFLIERIEELTTVKIIIPTSDIINFKEAILFAFLGILRREGQSNCLQSVTGAMKDSSGGAIYLP